MEDPEEKKKPERYRSTGQICFVLLTDALKCFPLEAGCYCRLHPEYHHHQSKNTFTGSCSPSFFVIHWFHHLPSIYYHHIRESEKKGLKKEGKGRETTPFISQEQFSQLRIKFIRGCAFWSFRLSVLYIPSVA